MTILEYIDLDDVAHIKAIAYLFKKGVWPKAFYSAFPKDLKFTPGWKSMMAYTLAERYVNWKIRSLK